MKLQFDRPYRGWATDDKRMDPGDVVELDDEVAAEVLTWDIAHEVHGNTKPTVEDGDA